MLGSPVEAQALAGALTAPQSISPSEQGLLEQAQPQGAEAEISTAKADLLPKVYLRAESQYRSFSAPNTTNQSRWFVGLSSLTQVSAAQGRYSVALADNVSTRLSLGEQIQSD